ncbi:MAG: helix-turn-helix domain-containing protein [Actinobacteria bacterium]|nr:helix-turn-helix domain-containing protein [Actinomycetota bacterium]
MHSKAPRATEDHLQAIVDALSVALGRPVLLDDEALVPLAYSSQWGEIDAVRSDSILHRGANPEVRARLFGHGIAEADGPVKIPAEEDVAMAARVAVPVRDNGVVLGYLWLVDSDATLTDLDIAGALDAARPIAAAISRRGREAPTDRGDLLMTLRSADPLVRSAALAAARGMGLPVDEPLVACLCAGGTDVLPAVLRATRRLSAACAGTLPEGVALLAGSHDPALWALDESDVAEWVRVAAGGELCVGQSAAAAVDDLGEAFRQAEVALRVARRRAGSASAAWPTLGADRLLAQLPPSVLRDVPAPLRRLLAAQPDLAATLSVYLDLAGDVQRTAAALSMHRSGVYYRLRRIEEETGLDLDDGDDRLLAHLAIRAEQLS